MGEASLTVDSKEEEEMKRGIKSEKEEKEKGRLQRNADEGYSTSQFKNPPFVSFFENLTARHRPLFLSVLMYRSQRVLHGVILSAPRHSSPRKESCAPEHLFNFPSRCSAASPLPLSPTQREEMQTEMLLLTT